MLVVLAVISILAVLMVPVVARLTTAGDLTRTIYDVSGTLEQARSYAVANNTYTWVGFYEEANGPSSSNTPIGRIVLSTVASKDGTRLYSDANANPLALDSTRLVQVGKLVKCNSVHLENTSDKPTIPPRTAPDSTYQVGDDSFAKRVDPGGNGPVTNMATFNYPIGSPTASASPSNSSTTTYTFTKIIQFSPLGDATKIVDSATRYMEIGLRPTRGNVVDANSKNYAAIQVAGVGGQVSIYRP